MAFAAPARAAEPVRAVATFSILADLDERFDQGQLDKAAYHRERGAKKQRLRALSELAVGARADDNDDDR